MLLHDLLDGIDVLELRGESGVDVDAVVHDSRDSRPGALFCCVRGAVTDGHAHAAAAVASGARALLVERFVDLDVTQVRVASVRAALGPVSARFWGHPSRSMKVLGVTGTNGKTTTTYLLEAIALAAGESAGAIGTVETRYAGRVQPPGRTTPEATDLQALLAAMRDSGVETVVMEVSSHALDQHRVDATWFAAACFTNLSHDHLDYHDDLDAYFEAKAMLFDPERTAVGVVNVDDERGRRLTARCESLGLPLVTFGVESADAKLRAVDVELGSAGSVFTILGGDEPLRVRTTLVGGFNVSNALAAAATACSAGFPGDAIVAGLQSGVVVPGRMERVDTGRGPCVIVDYAHTPDALQRVLAAVRPIAAGAGGRVIVVYGCGGDRDRAKRPLMGAVAASGADIAYLTSDNPRGEDPGAIVEEILAGVPESCRPRVEPDRRLAIRAALTSAGPADVVVIAGKGHETGQTAGGATRPFDDRSVARDEMEALGCT